VPQALHQQVHHCGAVLAYGTTANTYIKYCGTCTSYVQCKPTNAVACTSYVQNKPSKAVAVVASGNDVPIKMPCTQTPSTGVAVVALGHGALTKRLTQLLINQVRIMRSRSSLPCYNKSNSNAQSPKLIYSAQGPEPKNQVRIVRSRSSVPCYNKSRRDSSTYSSQPRPGSSRKSASHRAGAKP
jgi:hypothetical protein